MEGVYIIEHSKITVGRVGSCSILCNGCMEMSALHATITEACVLKMNGKNGGFINGHFLSLGETYQLKNADEISLPGVKLIWLNKMIIVKGLAGSVAVNLKRACPAEISEGAPEYFRKSPRMYYASKDETVELDAPPQKQTEEETPVFITIMPALAMALPMLIGFLISKASAGNGASSSAFAYMGLITAVCSALTGAFIAVTNLKNRRRRIIISEIRRKKSYTGYVYESENLIKDAYNRNVSSLRLTYPEIGEYFLNDDKSRSVGSASVLYDKAILWNRGMSDDDFLNIRIGTGNIPYNLNVTVPKSRFSVEEDELKNLPALLKKKYSILKDVPVTVNLIENRITGIVCESGCADELFLMIVMQLAVTVSPEDLFIETDFKSGIVSSNALRAVRFLPHLESREGLLSDGRGKVILTDVQGAGAAYFEQSAVIVFSDNFAALPSECRFLIQAGRNFTGVISLSKISPYRQAVHLDLVKEKDAERYAGILAGIRVRSEAEEFILPDKISFYELYGKVTGEEFVKSSWANNSARDSISIPVGIAQTGEILQLDLHEKGMGPHGLIAGMTGSGKSEILQTIILSLAVKYSPLDVGFFLIDYKGGGMAKLFSGLPHVMGSISNLSGRMISRAMLSVKSENERRMRLFSDAGVNNIAGYSDLYRSGIVSVPLPHIFIIIDEFAELKREEPEFMKELISVARVGRSLGIHLLLATQKPSGVVDDNILGNSRFRICLKVQDKSDSMELLKRPDAQFITNPGQGYLQVGADEVFVKFQGAYTMDVSERLSPKRNVELFDERGIRCERGVLNSEREAVGGLKARDELKVRAGLKAREARTQLERTIEAIVSADEIGRFGSLWLEPLGRNIVYESRANFSKGIGTEAGQSIDDDSNSGIRGDTGYRIADKFEIAVGIYDNPARQEQGKYYINIINNGNHIILGMLQSGKSTLLATISYALQMNLSPEMLNMYFIDFSHGLLRPFKNSVMTGGYICEENEEETEKLFMLLEGVIARRKEILRGGNFRQFLENQNSNKLGDVRQSSGVDDCGQSHGQLADGDVSVDKSGVGVIGYMRLPAVVVVIDNIGAFREHTKYEFDRRLETILKSGEALGVYVIASALNISSSEIPRKMYESFKMCIPLQLKDRYEYRECFAAQADGVFIPEAVPGRGLVIAGGMNTGSANAGGMNAGGSNSNGMISEFQAYRPVDADNDFESAQMLDEEIEKRNEAICVQYEEKELMRLVRHVPVIPENLTVEKLVREVERRAEVEGIDLSRQLPIGFFRKSGLIFAIPKVKNLTVVITGRRGSGKTNLIGVIGFMDEHFMSTRGAKSGTGKINSESEYEMESVILECGMKVVVADERLAFNEISELKKEAGSDPYVIHLGGALDRQNFADYSYIPYSRQSEILPVGVGTVRKTLAGYPEGQIIVPRRRNDFYGT